MGVPWQRSHEKIRRAYCNSVQRSRCECVDLKANISGWAAVKRRRRLRYESRGSARFVENFRGSADWRSPVRRLHSSLSPDLVKTFFALALVSVAFGCARRPSSPEPALNSISGDRMLADIRTLSSDEFQGRGPGSKGEELTIQYLQDQFRSAGLEPGNPDGTYLQAVRLVGITADPQTKLSFNGHGESLAPKF